MKAAENAKLPRLFLDWREMLRRTRKVSSPTRPSTNLLYGLREAIEMLHEEGLENVFARHDRHAEATRRAVRAWGLEIWCKAARQYSSR